MSLSDGAIKKGERTAPLFSDYRMPFLVPDGTGLSPAVSIRYFERHSGQDWTLACSLHPVFYCSVLCGNCAAGRGGLMRTYDTREPSRVGAVPVDVPMTANGSSRLNGHSPGQKSGRQIAPHSVHAGRQQSARSRPNNDQRGLLHLRERTPSPNRPHGNNRRPKALLPESASKPTRASTSS